MKGTIMERVKKIVKGYEQADFFERMCLFLQHRDLRNDFQKMEIHDHMTERILPSSSKKMVNKFLNDITEDMDYTKRRQ
jgi:hypothetical protein